MTDLFQLADRLATWANDSEIPSDKTLLNEAANAVLDLSSVRLAEAERDNPRFQAALRGGDLFREQLNASVLDLIRKARADAWDEGCKAAIDSVERDEFIPVNPYRALGESR